MRNLNWKPRICRTHVHMFNCKMIVMYIVSCDTRVLDPPHLNANGEDLEDFVHYFGPIWLDLFWPKLCGKFQIATFKRLIKFWNCPLQSCKMIVMLCDTRDMDPPHLNANGEDLEDFVQYLGPIWLVLFGPKLCWKFQIATFKRLIKFWNRALQPCRTYRYENLRFCIASPKQQLQIATFSKSPKSKSWIKLCYKTWKLGR